MPLRQNPSQATAAPTPYYHHPSTLQSPPTPRNAMRINKLECLRSLSGLPPPHTKHPPSPSSPTSSPPPSRFPKTSPPVSPLRVGLPPDPLIILGIFLIIFIAAYTLHFFLWTYFPPDAIIPNETDLNIIVGAADRRRRPRVQGGRSLEWGEEEEEYEAHELWKLPAEGGEGGVPPAEQ